jgi:hypothetical protein
MSGIGNFDVSDRADMEIQQAIIDYVFHGNQFDYIRGLIAEQGLVEGTINRGDFTGASFWSKGHDRFAVAYSSEIMVLTKNGHLHGVAKYDASVIPATLESQFSRGDGAIALANGML